MSYQEMFYKHLKNKEELVYEMNETVLWIRRLKIHYAKRVRVGVTFINNYSVRITVFDIEHVDVDDEDLLRLIHEFNRRELHSKYILAGDNTIWLQDVLCRIEEDNLIDSICDKVEDLLMSLDKDYEMLMRCIWSR